MNRRIEIEKLRERIEEQQDKIVDLEQEIVRFCLNSERAN